MSSNGKNGSIQTLNPVLPEIPKREDIFSLEGNSNQLQPFLLVDKPPENLKETPPILSFQRKRDIEIPWEQVLDNTATEEFTSLASIREYFESSWGLSANSISEEDLNQYVGPHVHLLTVYRPKFDEVDKEGKPTTEEIKDRICLQHGTSGRWYLPWKTNPHDKFSVDDFKTLKSYNEFWDGKIKRVELIFKTPEKAQEYFTECEELETVCKKKMKRLF